jgi:hypothetical protein
MRKTLLRYLMEQGSVLHKKNPWYFASCLAEVEAARRVW